MLLLLPHSASCCCSNQFLGQEPGSAHEIKAFAAEKGFTGKFSCFSSSEQWPSERGANLGLIQNVLHCLSDVTELVMFI